MKEKKRGGGLETIRGDPEADEFLHRLKPPMEAIVGN